MSVTALGILLLCSTAQAAALKNNVTVDGSVIYASDLFDGIAENHDAVLGNSPAPGKTMMIGALTLDRVAKLYDIDWSPSSGSDQVIVTRSAQVLSGDTLANPLREALAARGVVAPFDVLIGNVAPSMTLPGDAPATVEVTQLNYTPGRDVFTAVLVAPSASNALATLSISGTIEKIMQVPVLKSSLKSGDVIGSTDIEWIDMPVRQMVRDTVADADVLIGKTPVRYVDAGSPVRVRDITAPQLVARGDEVMVQFTQGTLILTTRGKAMQPGAEGDVIRVVNLSSNQSVRGLITGDKQVRVE